LGVVVGDGFGVRDAVALRVAVAVGVNVAARRGVAIRRGVELGDGAAVTVSCGLVVAGANAASVVEGVVPDVSLDGRTI
jgi:hypothetical protein